MIEGGSAAKFVPTFGTTPKECDMEFVDEIRIDFVSGDTRASVSVSTSKRTGKTGWAFPLEGGCWAGTGGVPFTEEVSFPIVTYFSSDIGAKRAAEALSDFLASNDPDALQALCLSPADRFYNPLMEADTSSWSAVELSLIHI